MGGACAGRNNAVTYSVPFGTSSGPRIVTLQVGPNSAHWVGEGLTGLQKSNCAPADATAVSVTVFPRSTSEKHLAPIFGLGAVQLVPKLVRRPAFPITPPGEFH